MFWRPTNHRCSILPLLLIGGLDKERKFINFIQILCFHFSLMMPCQYSISQLIWLNRTVMKSHHPINKSTRSIILRLVILFTWRQFEESYSKYAGAISEQLFVFHCPFQCIVPYFDPSVQSQFNQLLCYSNFQPLGSSKQFEFQSIFSLLHSTRRFRAPVLYFNSNIQLTFHSFQSWVIELFNTSSVLE